MYLDYSNTAAAALYARDIGLNRGTWDRCMAKTPCKIAAIVGIAIAALIVLWVLSFIIRCACLGFSCVEAICCCCSRRRKTTTYVERPPLHFENPNMYPRVQPMRQAEPSYQPVNNAYQGRDYDDGYTYNGYKPQQF
ncbi:CIC11C00000003377 [Sungouiella intermedia]|uniref:CIC11C00000000444 n=1 Tax=Sungouiella intermedia TaxID=45354 RepID=A0A1L0G5S6_9ASCO|nr:CIC11C00000003377 [[Candida] intermedia]SGZ51893.1 CIC11C00000000444 [[Candida] intermedia]